MRRVRRATIGGLAWTLVLCCLVTAGVALGQNAPVAPDRRAVQNRQAAFRKLEKDYAAVKPSALWDFYKKHAPDRIAEFERDCKTSKTKALKTLTEMAERYLDLQAIRQRSEEEYKRMLELVELESEARELGRRVAALAKSSPAAGDVGHKSLLETRKKLRKALERVDRAQPAGGRGARPARSVAATPGCPGTDSPATLPRRQRHDLGRGQVGAPPARAWAGAWTARWVAPPLPPNRTCESPAVPHPAPIV
jgi:hypothetical protein